MKAIIGAVLIDGLGGPPLSNSIVLVAGQGISAAGAHSTIPIPAEADKVDGSGNYLVPAIVDVCDRADPPGWVRPASPEQARSQVTALAATPGAIVHAGKLPPALLDAVLEAARDAKLPVTGHIATAAEARAMVDGGAVSLVGMIRDTEKLDSELLSKLRDLRIVVAPALSKAGASLEIAKRNTRQLFQAGVPLAIATEGGDPVQEAQLLVDAGVPPLDVIVAATRNGALALHQAEERGTIAAGRRADLLLVSANPGEDIRNLRRVALRMMNGKWVR